MLHQGKLYIAKLPISSLRVVYDWLRAVTGEGRRSQNPHPLTREVTDVIRLFFLDIYTPSVNPQHQASWRTQRLSLGTTCSTLIWQDMETDLPFLGEAEFTYPGHASVLARVQ